MVGGGLLIGLSTFMGADSATEFALLQLVLLLGFVGVAVATALLARDSTRRVWSLALAGSVVWLVGWSWGFHLGLILNVPAGVFGTVAGGLYSAAAVAAFSGRARTVLPPLAMLAAGSFVSAGVAFTDVVFIPQFTFLPFAVAAIVAGVSRLALRTVRETPHQI